ncbi:hypothetical protein BDV37DRAFT_284356 [Aspergillus pseudonomiae]|uniref:Uncharacterized protein n=1 Tax=Aspergillus pseudonomiae TaxID=1506151 RepID=A0A5N7D8W0_9EURO|nr:uncharacterized protein BDV37DRAFT_284356 [Aspergillus pseudonomiae]KAE8402861.1 hypothetical protein BDV37DRAFT_284356 [Aspergillus pseudonomiae]
MDVNIAFQPKTLLRHEFPALASHFHSLIQDQSSVEQVHELNRRLLELTYQEALPPAIYGVWLPIALRVVPDVLQAAIQDPVSHGVREAGIRALARAFHSKEWKAQGWDALGGAEGIRDLLTELSVREIVLVFKSIATCRHVAEPEILSTCVEDLIRLLQRESPSRLSPSLLRPLYPLCSSTFLKDLLSGLPEGPSLVSVVQKLGRLHADLVQQVAVGHISVPLEAQVRVLKDRVHDLIDSPKPYTPLLARDLPSDMPPGLVFCLDLYHVMSENFLLATRVGGAREEYIKKALRLACRKNLPSNYITIFLQHMAPLWLRLMRTLLDDSLPEPLFQEVIGCWSIARCGTTGTATESTVKRFTRSNNRSRPTRDDEMALESILKRLINSTADPRENLKDARPLLEAKLLEHIAPSERLAFIRLVCQHSEQLRFDIDMSPPSEREKKLVPIWHFETLRVLPDTDGQRLFDRMLAIHGCEEFIPTPPEVQTLSWTDQCLLKIGWEARAAHTDDLPFSHKVIREMQEEARRGRDHEHRLKWAGVAVDAALATSSADIFTSVVQWTQRFLRDPLVFPDLLKDKILGSEVASFISCVDISPACRPTSISQLSDVVQGANKSLDNVLELVLLASQEPGGKKRSINRLLNFISKIVESRIRGLKQYQPLDSQSEVANVLLNPLIPLFLAYECIVQPDEEPITNKNRLKGLLANLECPAQPAEAAIMFIDNLAERRDRLWQKTRTNTDIAISRLGKGWPKGLPIQYLVPGTRWAHYALQYTTAAPYLRSRLENVMKAPFHDTLTPKPELDVMPSDEWVDSLRYAIESYVGIGEEKNKTSLVSLFQYYKSELENFVAGNQQHFEQLQMFRQWLRGLAETMEAPEAAAIIDQDQYTRTPNTRFLDQDPRSHGMFVWDPRYECCEEEADEEPTDIPVTLLYCRMYEEIPTSQTVPFPQDEAVVDPLSVWTLDRTSPTKLDKPFLECQEAVILSSILFLHTNEDRRPLVSSPFPNSASMRYPRVSLDDRFMMYAKEDSSTAGKRATQALKKFIKAVPARLLRDLVMSLLDTAEDLSPKSTSYGTVLAGVTDIIVLLGLSDRPELAVDVVNRVIQSLPDASSYHRHMRLIGLGRRLQPGRAKDFIEQFAKFVTDGLEQNKKQYNQSTSDNSETADQPKHFVKITTVKMLGEILAEAAFLPTTMNVSVLQNLFNKSHHIDVRARVVSAALCLFDKAFDTKVIFSTIAGFASQVVGPREAEPTSEAEWIDAENGGKLPTVSLTDERPALDLFVKTAYHRLPKEYMAEYVQKILLPLVDESARQHKRWMKVFLSRTVADMSVLKTVDFGPFHIQIIDEILGKWKEYLPASFLRRRRDYALSCIHQLELERVTQAIAKRDPGYRQTNAGKHWSQYIDSCRTWQPLGHLKNLLGEPVKSKVPDGITIESLATEYVERAAIIARHPIKFASEQGKFVVSTDVIMDALESLLVKTRGYWETEYESQHQLLYQKLLEEIAADVESLRTEEWRNSIDRQPVVLPSWLELQVTILPSPKVNPLVEEPHKEFVRRVLLLVESCAEEPAFLAEFKLLEEAMETAQHAEILSCALLLGNGPVSEHTSLYGTLRIQLAQNLVSRLDPAELELNDEVKAMLRKWKTSPSEYVRGVGWRFDNTVP